MKSAKKTERVRHEENMYNSDKETLNLQAHTICCEFTYPWL